MSIYPYGLPCTISDEKKNLLELFVFVLHENRAIDNIDNANRISATRCNLRCGFVAIIRVGFKYYIPDLETKKFLFYKEINITPNILESPKLLVY